MNQSGEMTRGQLARRKEIIDAARSLAAEQGWPAVTVRAVAGRVGCSAPALYQYFRDKEAILAALAVDGQTTLSLVLETSIGGVHGPAKRLRAMVKALWDFAIANRALYAVMFGLDGLKAQHSGYAAPAILTRISADLLVKRDSAEDARDLADRIGATVHGFISLAVGGDFSGGSGRAFALLSAVIDAMVKDLGRG